MCRRLADAGEADYATSCTTRSPRPGELDGRDYFFLSREAFEQKVANGDFLEHAEVHGNFYGTLRSEVVDRLVRGRDVVLDIDVQGAAQVRACDDLTIRTALVDLFVTPPSEAELRNRLTGRATDSPEVIEKRMTNSLEEMRHWHKYSYRIISGTMEDDYANFIGLLKAERLRASRHHDHPGFTH